MANGYPDFGPDFTGTPANDNNPGAPWQDDVTLPDWAGGGKGFAPPVRQPFKPRIVPPSAPDPRFVADPNQVQQSPTISRSSIVRSLLGKMAPWAGGLAGGTAGMYFGSTQPAETGEFHPNVRFDPATSGFKPGTTFYDPLSGKPTGLPNQPMHPDSAPFPKPYESGFPYPSPDAGIGQGPFAGRPAPDAGIGQGPFAGRPNTPPPALRNGPGDRPSGIPPTYAPAVPPPRPRDQVAAQKPDLGYYGQTNIDPLGRGGRRWGGPLDAPQSTAFDLSRLFQGQPQ